MKQRTVFALALTLACTPAFAQQSVESCFNTLTGEWSGQVTTRNGPKASSSIIDATNRLENNGSTFASCYEGFSFGQPFQGGCVFNAQTNRFAFSDSLNPATARGSFRPLDGGNGFVYSFDRADAKSGKTMRYEQVTTIVSNDNYTVTCWWFDQNGNKREFMSMDMMRMPTGRLSDAADNFSSSPTLAKARQTLNSAQATADDTK